MGVRVLPQGYWYTVLYSSVVLLLCLLVCLVGAHIYSRTAFVILLVITVTLLSIFVSSLAVKPRDFVITRQLSANQSAHYNASYTGYNATTLRNNLGRKRRCFRSEGLYFLKAALDLKAPVHGLAVLMFFSPCSWLCLGLQHQHDDVLCYGVCRHVHQLHWDHGGSQHVRSGLLRSVSNLNNLLVAYLLLFSLSMILFPSLTVRIY